MNQLYSNKKRSHLSSARAISMFAGALLLGGLMVTTSSAAANPVLEQAGPIVGNPEYDGSGCPPGTASVALSPDRDELSILFRDYIAETEEGRRMARKTCNFAVPIRVPFGLRVAVYQVDYRGYRDIPSGGRGEFSRSYFFAGQVGDRTTDTFSASSGGFLFRDSVRRLVWSECGGTGTIARSNTSIVARKRSADSQPEAYMAVDTADAEIRFYLVWEEC